MRWISSIKARSSGGKAAWCAGSSAAWIRPPRIASFSAWRFADLPAASFIDKLRVLAVRAEPPEVAPGETTALDLLAVEPLVQQLDGGAAEPLTAVWLACPLPTGAATVAPCGLGSGSAVATPPSCKDQPAAPLCLAC